MVNNILKIFFNLIGENFKICYIWYIILMKVLVYQVVWKILLIKKIVSTIISFVFKKLFNKDIDIKINLLLEVPIWNI